MKGLRLSTLSTGIVFIALLAVTNIFGQAPKSGNVKTDIGKVRNFAGTEVIHYAGSSLSRNNGGMFWNISTSGLTPGEVVTLWVVIFNDPSACDQTVPGCLPPDLNNPLVNGSLQYGGGAIVGAGGRADFSGYLEVGDNTGFYRLPPFPNMPDPAPGLVNPKGAEVHLVIRKHGQASQDPATLALQLTTFGGGCGGTPEPCANIQAAVHNP